MTLNDPRTRTGLWLRYTLDAAPGAEQPVAEVWASAFHVDDPARSSGMLTRVPLDGIGGADGAFFKAGQHELRRGELRGEVRNATRHIRWDLRFDETDAPFFPIDGMTRRVLRPTTMLCAPNWATSFSGTVELDGVRLALDNAPGTQQHVWGTKHAEEWAWVHCNAFQGSPGTVFEALTARVKRGPLTMPAMTMMCLRHEGRDLFFNSLWRLLTNKSRIDRTMWSFSARSGAHQLSGAAVVTPGQMLQARYVDPDGAESYCANSEIASLSLSLATFAGAGPAKVVALSTDDSAHFELGSRLPRTDVRMITPVH